jgi:cytochrome P450
MALQLAPGPTGLGLIQSILGFYREPLPMFDNLIHHYGDVARLALRNYRLYVIVQPDHIKHVLQDRSSNYQIAGIFDETRPVVGAGLTTSNGDSWRRQRRLVQPAFHRQHIGSFASLIATATHGLVEKWNLYARDRVRFDIWPDLLQLNHQILGQILFGIDLRAAHGAVLEALEVVRSISVKRSTTLLKTPATWPTPDNRRFQEAAKLLNTFAYNLIDAHRRGSTASDVLAMLLAARDENGLPMTDQELHDEIMTLFFAAYEDPANALTWAWYLLAHNPAAEQRLRTELTSALHGRPPALADLACLPYTTMVIEETLRLYPPTWGILRDAVDDDEIGGYAIPAGSTIYVDTFHTHRLPAWWPNPEHFDPFRFAAGPTAARPRFAYLPFGGGPRQCIGNALAMMQLQITLAMLIQGFRFQVDPDRPIKIDARNSLRPKSGLWVTLFTNPASS